jgi:hypothetical protein
VHESSIADIERMVIRARNFPSRATFKIEARVIALRRPAVASAAALETLAQRTN